MKKKDGVTRKVWDMNVQSMKGRGSKMNVYEKLRNAVKAALDDLEASGCDERTYDYLNEHFGNEGDCALVKLHKQLKDALDTPRRNCDVGAAEEQAERFILFCRRNSFRGVCNDSCKFANINRRLGWQKIGQSRCFAFWAQMPYKKGGVK